MRVLVVGGSGYVGGLVVPPLARHHLIRVLDPHPPGGGVEHLPGSAADYDALRAGMDGMDAVLHCAMGSHEWHTPAGAADTFTVNVTSVHLTLLAAHEAGVPHAVHVSSMSVFSDLTGRRLDESDPPDATDPYGLSKRLGEEVCRAAAHEWGLSVNILRLTWPTPDELWPAWGAFGERRTLYADDGTPVDATAASDLAQALLAALEHRDGLQVFTISGDRSAGLWSTAKARRILGWQPTFLRG
jgi:nucleoside-diphosphate-sugar epimerase